jgi:hypothetical protein
MAIGGKQIEISESQIKGNGQELNPVEHVGNMVLWPGPAFESRASPTKLLPSPGGPLPQLWTSEAA